MKRFICTLFLYLLCYFAVFGTHIVGGNFQYKHLFGDTYELHLKMYRDCSPGTAEFNPEPLRIGIFDLATHEAMDTIPMSSVTTYILNYDSVCINAVLKCVEVRIYTAVFTMPNSIYNNTDGYYVSWERCCRNNVIKNIRNPGLAAMAFYMEIPSPYPNPLFVNNNSPVFTVDPLNFMCVGSPFTYNFNAKDPDNDELRFSLVTPLNGTNTSNGAPNGDNTIIGPGPYNDIIWGTGYGLTNIMDGSPDLTIDPVTGELSVNPTDIGVYVISILCEEFRNGIKIGEVRREVQFEVLDCPPPRPPHIDINTISQVVNFPLGQKTCFKITGSDSDANDLLEIYAVTSVLNPFSSGATLSPTVGFSLINGEFCWTPSCTIDTSLKVPIKFIIADQTCPFRLRDTIEMMFTFSKGANMAPIINSNLTDNTIDIRIGEEGCFTLTCTDQNIANVMELKKLPGLVDVYAAGAVLSPYPLSGNNMIQATFCWTPPCDFTTTGLIDVQFRVEDNAGCNSEAYDTITVTINVLPFANNDPKVSTTLPGNHAVFMLGRNNCFTITGTDPDTADYLEMAADLGSPVYGDGAVIYPEIAVGQSMVNSQFCWNPSCAYQAGDSAYVRFLIRDNKCMNEKFDELDVLITFEEPKNNYPYFVSPEQHLFYIEAGQSVDIELKARDDDVIDTVYMDMQPFEATENSIRPSFKKASGKGQVSSVLHIETPCDYLGTDIETLSFFAYNETCYFADTTFMEKKFVVLPLRIFDPKFVPTAFSPNNDGVNDVFRIETFQEISCTDLFTISIYDRWGQLRFRSSDPDFQWDGKDALQGAYVYIIKTGKKSRSGTVSLIR